MGKEAPAKDMLLRGPATSVLLAGTLCSALQACTVDDKAGRPLTPTPTLRVLTSQLPGVPVGVLSGPPQMSHTSASEKSQDRKPRCALQAVREHVHEAALSLCGARGRRRGNRMGSVAQEMAHPGSLGDSAAVRASQVSLRVFQLV